MIGVMSMIHIDHHQDVALASWNDRSGKAVPLRNTDSRVANILSKGSGRRAYNYLLLVELWW